MNIPNVTIENYQEHTVSLLKKLVEFETCDPPGREIELSTYLYDYLRSNAVDAQLDEFIPGRSNVLARIPGSTDNPALLFSSHQDTVPVGTQPWTYPPFEGHIVDGRMYGRGTADMKSALASMTIAAILLAKGATRPPRDVILAFSAGESSNCIGAKRMLEQGVMDNVGSVIIGEPSSLELIIAEKGVVWLRATAIGKSGHVSGDGGSNAILRMMAFLERLKTVALDTVPHQYCTNTSLSVGTIEGGSAINVTPDRCVVQIDVRIPPGMDHRRVVEQIRSAAGEGLEIDMFDYKPAVETDADNPFVKIMSDCCEEVSRSTPKLLGVSYYSDGTILCASGNTPFVILGPGEMGMSGVTDESVILQNVIQAVDIYRRAATVWGAV
ncbi:M20 family metallopeptidase [Pseudomonas sp. M30-35]|uniref:M20 family metallopeptidase n=1 Tax=Pseudomonas sp. M30-35 TaxID=1981174 RepID=UPI000B3BE819|nr:M20 family metallopeptidase [Pseudomonas sp. M30-35]ARU88717.1 peptidase M20 [Pseudomonas sp. M30-35]